MNGEIGGFPRRGGIKARRRERKIIKQQGVFRRFAKHHSEKFGKKQCHRDFHRIARESRQRDRLPYIRHIGNRTAVAVIGDTFKE